MRSKSIGHIEGKYKYKIKNFNNFFDNIIMLYISINKNNNHEHFDSNSFIPYEFKTYIYIYIHGIESKNNVNKNFHLFQNWNLTIHIVTRYNMKDPY